MSHPFIPVPNTASVEMIYSYNGQIVENVFNVSKGSNYSLADLQAVRTIVNSWDAATWIGSRGSGAVLNRIRTKARDSSSAPLEDYALPSPRAGTLGGANMPGGSTYCFKLATGHQGRSYRGRWYLVGLNSAILNSTNYNLVNSASAAAIAGMLTTLMTNLAAGGHTLSVVSLRNNGVWRTTGISTPVTSIVTVDYNVDSQRRRLTGRGL